MESGQTTEWSVLSLSWKHGMKIEAGLVGNLDNY